MAANNDSNNSKNSRKRSKEVDPQRLTDLARYPMIYDLAAVAGEVAADEGPGRKMGPIEKSLIIASGARVFASQSEAVRQFPLPANLKVIAEHYEEMTGRQMPAGGISRDQVQYCVRKICTTPGVLEAMELRFRQAAVAQARELGNLLSGVVPDWACPDERHTIYGDGTFVKPFSDVYTVPHPRTGLPELFGSRARSVDTARIQRILTKASEDDKTAVGVNMVALHTWTGHGRVTLGTNYALGGELWAALELIESVAAFAGDGIHTLVWDRVFTGWPVEYLMAALRILTINKNVARSSDNNSLIGATPFTDKITGARAERLAAEYDAEATADNLRLLRNDMLAMAIREGKPLPLGTSIYSTEKGHDTIRGRVYDLGVTTHRGARGDCEHWLCVDDGGLFVVGEDPLDGHLVKLKHVTSTTATAEATPTGNVLNARWTVPCEHGDFTYRTRWEPSAERRTPDRDDEPVRTALQRALTELGVLSRADGERFDAVHGRRNDAESYNKWYKASLPNFGRAASLDLRQQRFDWLMAAVLNNSITWSRYLDEDD